MRRRLQAVVRFRVLRAVADWYGLTLDDEVGLAGEPQDLTDQIMLSLFGKWPPTG